MTPEENNSEIALLLAIPAPVLRECSERMREAAAMVDGGLVRFGCVAIVAVNFERDGRFSHCFETPEGLLFIRLFESGRSRHANGSIRTGWWHDNALRVCEERVYAMLLTAAILANP